MKIRILMIFVFFVGISNCVALENEFRVDVDKINVNAKDSVLVEELDKTYNIEIEEFSKEEKISDEAKDYTKKLIKLLFGTGSVDERGRALLSESYISSDNGFDTLTSFALISSFYEDIISKKITYDYIKRIKTVAFDYGVLSFTYFDGAIVDGVNTDFILVFYLKEVKDEYKLFMPWFSTDVNFEKYFKDVATSEDDGNIIGGTYKSISLDDTDKVGNEKLSDDYLKNIYDANYKYNVSISSLSDGAVSSYGSGFFIREGIIVTTWSLFSNTLNNGEFIYVNDALGNAYKISGVVAADISYDVVILKLEEEVGSSVILGDSSKLKTNEFLFTINSKNNTSFSVNYGTYISQNNGRLKNLFALSSSDQGSALYNKDGEVVAFNTSSLINSDISNANSSSYLKELQNILKNKEFKDIKSTDIKKFKDKYYYDLIEEEKINNVSERVWKKLSKIGDLEKNISLELLKASYKDNILSLRYKNSAINSLETLYLTKNYEANLIDDGYKMTYETVNKKVYENNKYEIIIKDNLDYLIIIIMEK